MSDMKILLLNAGSSSLKCSLMEAASRKVVLQQFADWAGPATHYQYVGPDGRQRSEEVAWRGTAEAVRRILHDLTHVEPVALAMAVPGLDVRCRLRSGRQGPSRARIVSRPAALEGIGSRTDIAGPRDANASNCQLHKSMVKNEQLHRTA